MSTVSLWNIKTDNNVGIWIERSKIEYYLPLANNLENIDVEIISGRLPNGTRLNGNKIVGTPFEVAVDTVFTCVFRAFWNGYFDDRTINFVITGSDKPKWQTIGKREYLYLKQIELPFKESVFEILGDFRSDSFGNDINYYNVPIRYLRGELPDNSKNVTLRYGQLGQEFEYNFYNNKTIDKMLLGEIHIDGNNRFNISNLIINKQNKNQIDTLEILKQYNLTNSDGLLPVGTNNTFFILDNEIIDFQLMATDNDLPAGDTLEYFIADGDGSLPPGINLSRDGRLYGTTEALLSLDKRFQYGGYDNMPYGEFPLDYAVLSGNGYSTFFYDNQTYDYSENTQSLKKLNRYFPFAVTVTDGNTFVRREFKIYLVGDDYLRADNTIMRSSTGVFTADITHVRTPRWITPRDLGFKRANNYTTIYLDILDNPQLSGTVSYTLESYNDDFSPSILPPGLSLDARSGEITGRLPYQPAITETYKFTVRATRIEGAFENLEIFANFYEDVLLGNNTFKIYKLDLTGDTDGISDLKALVGRDIILNNLLYKVIEVDDSNKDFDIIKVDETISPTLENNLILTRTAKKTDQEIFVSRLGEKETEKYLNRTLAFSDLEKYQITEITPYIEYEIKHNNLNFTIDEIKSVFQFNNKVYIQKLEDTRWRLRIPSTAKTRNISDIRNFVSIDDGSSQPAKVSILRDNEHQIKLDVPLQKDLNNKEIVERNIGISLFKDDFFSENIIVASEDETTRPSTVKTFEIKIIGEIDSTINWITNSYLGIINANYISNLNVKAETTVPDTNMVYRLTDGKLPYGLSLNHYGEIVGSAIQTGKGFYRSLWKNNKSYNINDIVRTDDKYYICTVHHKSSEQGDFINDLDKWDRYDLSVRGLTVFDSKVASWDGLYPNDTTFDRRYRFIIEARDRFNFSAISKEFILDVEDLDNTQYTDIVARPLLNLDQRQLYKDLISDSDIFNQEYIYRPDDENFGIKSQIEMLIFAGIESLKIEEFIASAAKNHKKTRYRMGSVQKAIARNPGTTETIYEVVYVPVIDPAIPKTGKTRKEFTIHTKEKVTADSVQYSTKDDSSNRGEGLLQLPVYGREIVKFVFSENGKDLKIDTRSAESISVNIDNADFVVDIRDTDDVTVALNLDDSEPQRIRPEPSNTIKADSNAIYVSDSKDQTRYISNINNMRDNISKIGKTEREYLPLWMRTPQEGFQELGFVSAIPICYCKPGTADIIISNIKNSNFDFKNIDFLLDRYIVKNTDDYADEKYIIFANYQFNL